jgi:hypothetical protein
MTMFLNAPISEFHAAITRLERNATGDYSPDQHLHTLPEYRRKTAPQSAAPRSGKTAMQLFEAYILATKLAAATVKRRRGVFVALDAYLAGRDFDALPDDEAMGGGTHYKETRRSHRYENLRRSTQGAWPMGRQTTAYYKKSICRLLSAGSKEDAAS